jgi:GT2 family glycosyltransferase/glycosyltransferase involved in cell wall biosynthesis
MRDERTEKSPAPGGERHEAAGASIVIPVYNAVKFAQACVESVYAAQTSVPFEVIVVDNGSGPEVASWLARQTEQHPGLITLRFEQPLGFSRAVNEGARRAKHDTLLVLNSDTLVTDGWLDGLEDALASDPQWGVVSPVTNYAGNPFQIDTEAAAVDPRKAQAYAARIRGRKELLPEPEVLVFFCVLIRRALWELLDGLEESYVPGNAEDHDFCLRARLAGYRLAVARNVFVFHHRDHPTFRANAIDHDAAMTRNKLRFCDRASRWARSHEFFKGSGSQWLPNVSVIVPVLGGRAGGLRDSLASLANQTTRGFQTIVVAPSGEELAAITQEFEGRLRIVNVAVEHAGPSGLAALLNAGLAKAERQWIACLPAGDIYYAFHLELLAQWLLGSCVEAVYAAWSVVVRSAGEESGQDRRAVVAMHGSAPSQLGLDHQPPLLCWMFSRVSVAGKLVDDSFNPFSGLELVLWMSRQLRVQYVPRVSCECRLGPERPTADPLCVSHAQRLLEKFPSATSWQDKNRVRFLEAVETGSWEEFPLIMPGSATLTSYDLEAEGVSDDEHSGLQRIPRRVVKAARRTYRALVPLQVRYGIERRMRYLFGLPPILRTDGHGLQAVCDALAKAILQTTQLPRPPGPRDILLFSVIRWDHLVQRSQHLARGLAARGHRVYWIDIRLKPPDRVDPASLVKPIEPGLFYVELPGAAGELYPLEWDATVLAAMEMAVAHIRATCGIHDAIQLINYPKWAPLAFRLRERFGWPIVYDCLDDQKGFSKLFQQNAADFEDTLAQQCDLLVTCSRLLDQDRRSLNPNTVLILNACDYNLFHSGKPAGLLSHLPHPIIGFFGAFSDWLDLDWIAESAKRFPTWSFVYIGRASFATSAAQDRWKALAFTANIHMFPQTDPQTLASYLAEFDVCTMPFRDLPITRVMNAVKIYEYLAAGKPVVIPDVAELRPLGELGLIAMYRDREQSFRLLEQAVQIPATAEQLAARLAFASENTWAQRIDQMEEALSAIGRTEPAHAE